MSHSDSPLRVSLPSQSSVAAHVAAAGTLAVALLILALHLIKPELDPSWRFISEYATGDHAWIMQLTFLVWGASCLALAMSLKDEVRSGLGSVGVVALFIAGSALVLAGVFSQDPVTSRPDQLTMSGSIHTIASIVGVPGLPLAAVLISAGVARNHLWSASWRPIMWFAHATWMSLLVMTAYLIWTLPQTGGFNENVWAGWMNRIVVAAYLGWMFIAAISLIRRTRT